MAYEVLEHFALTNRGKSITSRLREPLSIRSSADSAVPAAEGGIEREVGMEMIALQAVKCAAVLRTLCGHTALHAFPILSWRSGVVEGEGGAHT